MICSNRERALIAHIVKNLEVSVDTTGYYDKTTLEVQLRFEGKVISKEEVSF
jgi:hypothetical protein